MNRWLWLVLVICIVNLKPCANDPRPMNYQQFNIAGPDPTGTGHSTYTYETCTYKCHSEYGYASCGAARSMVIVAYGKLAYGGNSCDCLATKEILAAVAAANQGQVTFPEFVRQGPEAAKAYLDIHKFYVTYPVTPPGQTQSSSTGKPKKKLFGFGGSSSSSAATAVSTVPVFQPGETVIQPPGTIMGSAGAAPYTAETCDYHCRLTYGRFAYPIPREGTNYETFPITYGQVEQNGFVCNCIPTREIMAKLATKRQASFDAYVRYSPDASRAYLYILGCQMEFPTSMTGYPASPTSPSPPSSPVAQPKGKGKGIKSLFGFKKSKGGTSGRK